MRLLLVTPPLTQLNTPYPATTVLKGFLGAKGIDVCQLDLGIELADKVLASDFLSDVFSKTADLKKSKNLTRIFSEKDRYIACVEPVVRFLRGQEQTLAARIANRSLLPEGPRFDNLADVEWAFGVSGTADKARYLATLFLEDISDYIRETVSPHFDLVRYAEHLVAFAPSFDGLEAEIEAHPSVTDCLMLDILKKRVEECNPDIVGFSVPFPGCLYAALRCGRFLKENFSEVKIVLGGGFPNTELRNLKDSRIFKYVDFITLDDGELPLLRICELVTGRCEENSLVRTYYLKDNELVYSGNDSDNIPFREIGTPDFEGLPMEKYISMTEVTNPMHKLWSCGLWNKMVMAHGCYWAKCAFCDVSLDYICRYEAPTATMVVDRMEAIMKQTGQTGFHFTDEAMPPNLLRKVSEEILRRNLVVSFWGNIRFDKSYTQEFCDLLAQAGCVAVSGGLEVASDRILKLMNKGVSISQTTEAAFNLTSAGIMVHTYLMYGFPTETLKESVNALEVVRQMFEAGIVQSAFWHRYAMTAHSPSGQAPELYGAKRSGGCNQFCNNEVDFEYDFGYDLEALGAGLNHATLNYMHDLGFDIPVFRWFDFRVPKPDVAKDYVQKIISKL